MEKEIKVRSLEVLGSKLAKINKKFAKRGIPAIQIVSSTLQSKAIQIGENCFMEPIYTHLFWYEVTLELPVENLGFTNTTVLGYVERNATGDAILHPMSEGAAPQLEQYRNQANRCDHCKTLRSRKNVFVFLKDNQPLMIGKSCAKEYFGLDIAESLNEWICLEDEKDYNSDESGSRGRSIFDQSFYLACVLFLIKKQGFRSAKSCQDRPGCTPTSSRASDLKSALEGNKFAMESFKGEDLSRYREETKNLIEGIVRIREYYAALQTTDSFLLNCKAAMADEGYSRTGLLAAAVNSYYKSAPEFAEAVAMQRGEWAAKKAAKDQAAAQSKHYGQVGERIDLVVTVIDKKSYEKDTEFGIIEGTILKMKAEDGISDIVWFTGADTYDYEVGKKYNCRGTVKKHDEYKGVKSTKLNRCKLTPIVEKAA